jgi:hypothetical protein
MRDSGVSGAVSQCAGGIFEWRGASRPANNAKRASRSDVEGANSPVEGLSKRNRLSCSGRGHRAGRANMPPCREVHGGVEDFPSCTQRPNVETGRPVLPYVCLISPANVPRYALDCPATAFFFATKSPEFRAILLFCRLFSTRRMAMSVTCGFVGFPPFYRENFRI